MNLKLIQKKLLLQQKMLSDFLLSLSVLKRFFYFIFFIFALQIGGIVAQAALPPWFYQRNLALNTLGNDPCIQVGLLEFPNNDKILSPENPIILPLNVCDKQKAKILAVVLKTIIGDSVKIEIRSPNVINGTFENWKFAEFKKNIDLAFKSNSYFAEVISGGFGPVVLFKPEVVQFYCDNISLPNGNCTLLAADAFATFFNEHIGDLRITVSTMTKQTHIK